MKSPKEKNRNKMAINSIRSNKRKKLTAKENNNSIRRSKRLNPEYRLLKNTNWTSTWYLCTAGNSKSSNKSWEKTATKYNKNIKEGFTHPCSCCGRLWHIKSIRKLSKQGTTNKFGEEFATNTFKLPNLASEIFGEICSTRAKYT